MRMPVVKATITSKLITIINTTQPIQAQVGHFLTWLAGSGKLLSAGLLPAIGTGEGRGKAAAWSACGEWGDGRE